VRIFLTPNFKMLADVMQLVVYQAGLYDVMILCCSERGRQQADKALGIS
jgi:hypothetical protein